MNKNLIGDDQKQKFPTPSNHLNIGSSLFREEPMYRRNGPKTTVEFTMNLFSVIALREMA